MKIRPKIQLAFLAIGLLPLILFGWFNLDRITSMIRARLIDQLESVTAVQQQRIETLLEHNIERLKLVSSRTQLRLNLARHLADPQESYRAGMLRILNDAQKSIPSFYQLAVVTTNGQVVSSTNPEWNNLDISTRDFFRKGLDKNQAETFITSDEGELLTILSGPLILTNRQIGVIAVIASGQELLEVTRSYAGLGETGETILVREDEEHGLQYLAPLRFDADATLRPVPADTPGYELLTLALQEGEHLAMETLDYRDQSVVAVARSVRLQETSANDASASSPTRPVLGLIVKIDRSEVFSLVRQLQLFSYLILGGTLVVLLVVSLVLSKSITRPIRTLVDTANHIIAGDLTRRAEVQGSDEITILANDFNRMAENLTDANRTLEEKVQQRTAELEAIQERYSLSVKGSTDGLWDWDVITNEVVYSDRFKELLGYPPDGFPNVFESFVSRLHPDDKDPTLAAVKRHLEDREPYDVEYRLKCRDDHYRWFRARGMAVWNKEGKPTRMAGSISDITDRKQAVQELKRSNQELEQFAYVASHDLKEPLRMITSYLQLLQQRHSEQLDKDAREFIEYAVDGALRMKRLIEDLLLFSRVGTQGRELEPTDVQSALNDALANLNTAIQERQADVQVKDTLPTVMGDGPQLTQLFQNLIANAIKFCPKDRQPEICVSAEKRGKMWELAVQDNGIGIEPGNVDRIFQIFQRACTRDEYEGTGIGLAICKKIVQRHGGEIRVESEEGRGSTFLFTLRET